MVKKMFNHAYRDRRVLLTGHTGFKGSWLALWLQQLGAQVTGLSLSPDAEPNHWNLLNLEISSKIVDIRNDPDLSRALRDANPEIVFHLAAQPLVRRSYNQPMETWSTNVLGTANLLNSCRALDNLVGIVIVTTDKCYLNREWPYSYREIDRLGGHDPYSASKAGAELVVESFRHSFYNTNGSPQLATVRAGNVIGGGDWSEDRLIPDVIRSIEQGTAIQVRSPQATRPWQHVLECLSGYLLLGQQFLEHSRGFDEAWNFGPGADGNQTVEDVLFALKQQWKSVSWNSAHGMQPHEAKLLQLDCSKAQQRLKWAPVLSFDQAIAMTAQWYRSWFEDHEILTTKQLADYIRLGSDKGHVWTKSNG
ncbi:CDP-glucose 4,6-dehydratase [Bacillus sp. DC4300-2b2]|uniref:CDP-glucose 4,6-dehydratase n=1 Tax=Bacillus sp. DC4300-2b2 TaxID=2809038 RepID=UPI003CF7CE3A